MAYQTKGTLFVITAIRFQCGCGKITEVLHQMDATNYKSRPFNHPCQHCDRLMRVEVKDAGAPLSLGVEFSQIWGSAVPTLNALASQIYAATVTELRKPEVQSTELGLDEPT